MKFTRQYSKRTKKFDHMKDQLAKSLVEQKKKMRKEFEFNKLLKYSFLSSFVQDMDGFV